MLTEMQWVVRAQQRKPSCGDVAAYTAVCCISDFGIVVGGDWKADEESLGQTEFNSGSPTKGETADNGGGKGLTRATRVWKSMTALAKESTRRSA